MNRSAPPAGGVAATAPPAGGDARLYIQSLDGLRALSFLLVFSSHSILIRMSPGGFGVTVFFFLSGYLITTLLRLEGEQRGTISLSAFYLRRTLRIFPPATLFVTVAALCALFVPPALGVSPPGVDPLGLLAGYGYLTNLFLITGHGSRLLPGTDVLWSLAIEEHFYLMFPLFYLVLRRVVRTPRRQALVLAFVCAALLGWRHALVSSLDMTQKLDQFRLTFATDTRIDSILFGCILALWGNPVLDPPAWPERWTATIGVAAAALTVFMLFNREVFYPYVVRYTLQGLALLPLFVCAIRYAERWPWAWLNGRVIRRWGVLSYSMYLFHVLVIDQVRAAARALGWLAVDAHWPQLLAADVVALAITYAIAELVNRLLDRPLTALRHRLQRVA